MAVAAAAAASAAAAAAARAVAVAAIRVVMKAAGGDGDGDPDAGETTKSDDRDDTLGCIVQMMLIGKMLLLLLASNPFLVLNRGANNNSQNMLFLRMCFISAVTLGRILLLLSLLFLLRLSWFCSCFCSCPCSYSCCFCSYSCPYIRLIENRFSKGGDDARGMSRQMLWLLRRVNHKY